MYLVLSKLVQHEIAGNTPNRVFGLPPLPPVSMFSPTTRINNFIGAALLHDKQCGYQTSFYSIGAPGEIIKRNVLPAGIQLF